MRVLLLVLLLPIAAAEPGVVVLVHHPDDGVDPLGVPWGGSDTFMARHGHLDRFVDGVDYPGFVADGRVPFEALATGDRDALDETLAVYGAAVTMRHGVESPAALRVTSVANGTGFDIHVEASPRTDLGDHVRLWSAVVEDRVFYQPPAALSNGVFEHPFTVRAMTDHGVRLNATFHVPVQADWDPEQLSVAVWLQQGPEGRFKAGEVLQATSHPVLAAETIQENRAVLVEGYSATWCEPCLIGDLALQRLAEAHGLRPAEVDSERSFVYFEPPAHPGPVVLLVALAFAAGALARVPERP